MEGPKEIDLGSGKIPEHFLSEDPCVVLGVGKKESFGSIRSARNNLVKIYHPDVNKDPNSSEIIKLVNLAFEKLRLVHFKHQQIRPSSLNKSRLSLDELIKKLESCLKNPNDFRKWVTIAKKSGLKNYMDLLKWTNIRKIINAEFINNIILLAKDNPDKIISIINGWEIFGINLKKQLKSEKVKNILIEIAIEIIKSGGSEKSYKFINFWKKQDVDLTTDFLLFDEVLSIIKNDAIYLYTTYGQKSNKFNTFVSEWKRMGVVFDDDFDKMDLVGKIIKT